MEPFFYHGIRDYRVDRLINILRTGYILPKKMLKDEFSVNRENELDLNGKSWISLSQKTLCDDYYSDQLPSSFDVHVLKHMCLVFNEKLNGIKYTNHLWFDDYTSEYIKKLIKDESSIRYSTYMDEVQTDIPVSTKELVAVGYPKEYFESIKRRYISDELNEIKKELKKGDLHIPVIDSSYYDFADDNQKIKKYTI